MTNEPIVNSEELPLSADTAFVVHVTSTGAGIPEAVRGRIEHITSGRSTHFTSTTQLITFMRDTLMTG